MSDQKLVGIGDIHGCPHSMEALLDKLSGYRDRTFVFVGDYIDRGPDSKRVVDFLLEFRERQDCIFLRGNHEQMLLDAYEREKVSLWLMNGARSTLQSYGSNTGQIELPEKHLEFYRETKMYYQTEDYFFVHAGLSPAKTIQQALEEEGKVREFLWERSHLNVPETPWEKTVVFGHTPKRKPIKKANMIGIDTGCVYKSMGYGTLTAVLLPEEEFIQQDCLD